MSHSEQWSLQTWRDVTIAQICSGALSFCCSIVMAVMISRSTNSMKKPYRRIIFGLAIADIFQSFALVSGPFSVPSSTEDSWGIGNEASCQANGVFLTFGQTAIPMYVCFLCFYYLCKLKYRMSDEEFRYKMEIKIHSFIVLYNIIIAGSAMVLGIYNTTTNRSFCHFARIPLGCRNSPDIFGECDTTIATRVDIYIIINVFALFCVLLCAIITMMVMLYVHANYSRKTSGANITRGGKKKENDLGDNKISGGQENTAQVEQLDRLSRLYYREVVIQATGYVGVFLFTNAPLVTAFFIQITASSFAIDIILIFFIALVYPIGGLFNILLYTRAKLVAFQRTHPECSSMRGFWLVLKAGGEMPDGMVELECCKGCSTCSCQTNTSAIIGQEDITKSKRLHETPVRIGGKVGGFNHGSSIPKVNTRNGDDEDDQSKFKGNDLSSLYDVECGDNKKPELSNGLSFSEAETSSTNLSYHPEISSVPLSDIKKASKKVQETGNKIGSSVGTGQDPGNMKRDKRIKIVKFVLSKDKKDESLCCGSDSSSRCHEDSCTEEFQEDGKISRNAHQEKVDMVVDRRNEKRGVDQSKYNRERLECWLHDLDAAFELNNNLSISQGTEFDSNNFSLSTIRSSASESISNRNVRSKEKPEIGNSIESFISSPFSSSAVNPSSSFSNRNIRSREKLEIESSSISTEHDPANQKMKK